MSEFKHLFTPIKIGSIEIPNRIMMSPHTMIGMRNGSPEQEGYFEARARGGTGFVGIASCQVAPTPNLAQIFLRAYPGGDLQAIKAITDSIRRWGKKSFVQLTWMIQGAQPSALAPQSVLLDTQPRSMTLDEIHQIADAHGIAAANMQAVGADAVEIPIGGGASLQYFTSRSVNYRTDDYGGSLENRVRIILEITGAIRARCGREFPLGYQINADLSPIGGEGIEESIAICKAILAAGKVDWLRITGRGQKPQMTQYHYPPSYLPQGIHLYAAAEVRKAIPIVPIISGGRIINPHFAEQAIDEGKCDMVFLARAVLADPEWANKARDGELPEIRRCIGDLEGCYMKQHVGRPIGCTVNPDVSYEHEPLVPTAKRKRVVIAGGGVAGMQAAMVAARRGHDVTLFEKSSELGGHVVMQSKLPGLEIREDIVRWLALQLDKLGVSMHLDTEASPERLAALAPDAVVVATGAAYSRLGISRDQPTPLPGHGGDNVLTPEDITLRGAAVGQKVVVYDNTGYVVGPGVAELLADQGKDVTLVFFDPIVARSMTLVSVDKVLSMRLAPKVALIASTAVTAIRGDTVTIRDLYTGVSNDIVGVDTVVLVGSRPPEEKLFHELYGKVPELHIVGDARESRWAAFQTDEAIKDGRRVGMLL